MTAFTHSLFKVNLKKVLIITYVHVEVEYRSDKFLENTTLKSNTKHKSSKCLIIVLGFFILINDNNIIFA